jgi:hypothetical protein
MKSHVYTVLSGYFKLFIVNLCQDEAFTPFPQMREELGMGASRALGSTFFSLRAKRKYQRNALNNSL